MSQTPQAFVVGIRFSKVGKLYHFDASRIQNILLDDRVVVETSRGLQLGTVAQVLGWVTPENGMGWKSVTRKATPADLLKRKSLESAEEELLELCRKAVFEKDLPGTKVVSVEYGLDGNRCSILYSIEGENKIDLRFLKQEVTRVNRNAQVELRQIGPRDVAKIIAGMGACGLPTRCCAKFLTDFSSISIKMAKEQGISLTPAEITGMCGRLRCCLIYEYSQYHEGRKQLPKQNKMVMTPIGQGKVVDVLPLKLCAVVDIPEVGRREFNHADMMPMHIYSSDPVKAAEFDEKHRQIVKVEEKIPPAKVEAKEEPKKESLAAKIKSQTEDGRPQREEQRRSNRSEHGSRSGKHRKGGRRRGGSRNQSSSNNQTNQRSQNRNEPRGNRNDQNKK